MATVDTRPATADDHVANLLTRVQRLEQRRNLSYTDEGRARFPGGIDTEGGGDAAPAPAPAPDEVTGLTLTPGALYNDVWIDADWSLPADLVPLDGVEIRIATVTDPGLVTETVTIAEVTRTGLVSSARIRALAPLTTYDVTVYSYGPGGVSAPLTARATTGGDTTVPATVAGLVMAAGLRTIVATWDEVPDADVIDGNGLYELELSADNGAGQPGALLRTVRAGGTIATIGDLDPDTRYHGRVRAVDASGNPGGYSDGATAVTGQAGTADLQIGAITADSGIIADAAIGTAQIGDAQVTNAKIVSASISKLTAGNLTVTQQITSGRIAVGGTGPGETGVYVDNSGIRLYDGAELKIHFDAATGTGTFAGEIVATGGSIDGNVNVAGSVTIVPGGVLATAPALVDYRAVLLHPSNSSTGGSALQWQDGAGGQRANISCSPGSPEFPNALTIGSNAGIDIAAFGDQVRIEADLLSVLAGADVFGDVEVVGHTTTSSATIDGIVTVNDRAELGGATDADGYVVARFQIARRWDVRASGVGANTDLEFYAGTSGDKRLRVSSSDLKAIIFAPNFGGTTRAIITDSSHLYLEPDEQLRSMSVYDTTTAAAANGYVSSAGALARTTSSGRFKRDVADLGPFVASDVLAALRPVRYASTDDTIDRQDWTFYGLIAEEVADVDPRLVHFEPTVPGLDLDDPAAVLIPGGVQYDRLAVLMLAEVARIGAQVAALTDLVTGAPRYRRPGGPPDWVQPQPGVPHPEHPYFEGAEVSHAGDEWVSTYDGQNVWEPGVQGTEALWTRLSPPDGPPSE